MPTMRYPLLLFILLLLLNPLSSVAEISISVDTEPVIVNESFRLTFHSDKKINVAPDFSALADVITIVAVNKSSQTSIVNFKATHSQQFVLTLIANKTGRIVIPAIKFGNDESRPYIINVVDAPVAQNNDRADDIIIEATVDNASPYVQQQIIYTVKLYIKNGVSVYNPSLSTPDLDSSQAVVEKLTARNRQYKTKKNGIDYEVIEQRYAIFPQQSGPLTIPQLRFQAQKGVRSQWLFSFDTSPKVIIKDSNTVALTIQAIPAAFTGTIWLPAKQLAIQEQWSTLELEQGQAATRMFRITAAGLMASQLPLVDNELPVTVKQYPEQPQFEDKKVIDGITGIRIDKMAIIPAKSGELILPAIKIPWWNTDTDTIEFAELPERSLTVTGTNAASSKPNDASSAAVPTAAATPTAEVLTADDNRDNPIYQWMSGILFILWVITLLLWWRRGRHTPLATVTVSRQRDHSTATLKKACQQNNAKAVETLLLKWANNNWPEHISSISDIKPYSDIKFQQQLDKLNQQLYSNTAQTWDGAVFLSCFQTQSFNEKKTRPKTTSQLAPLYKT